MADNPLLNYLPNKNPLMDYAPKANPLMAYANKPQQSPSASGVLTQFAIGAGNAAAFSVPELLNKKEFDKWQSPNQIERVARGTGTFAGSAIGAPQLVYNIGAKLALKSAAKIIPKLVAKAEGGNLAAKMAIEGIGGMTAINVVDPTTDIKQKVENIPKDVVMGAGIGLGGYALRKGIQSLPKKQAKLPTILEEPAVYGQDGKIISKPGFEPLTPTMAGAVDKDSKAVFKEVSDSVKDYAVKAEAQSRGLMPHEVTMHEAKKLVGTLNWDVKPGTALNAETLTAYTMDFKNEVLKYAKNPSPEAMQELGKKVVTLRGLYSEPGRATEIQKTIKPVMLSEVEWLKGQLDNLDPEVKEALSSFAKEVEKPGFLEKAGELIQEVRVAGMVGNPISQIRNVIGNSMYLLTHPFEQAFAGNAAKVESFITGKAQDVYSREALAGTVGVVASMRKASRNAIEAFKNPEFISDARVLEGAKNKNVIPGPLGEAVRFSFRGLGAMDEFFATLSKSSRIYELATRQALKEGSKDVVGRVSYLVSNPSVGMVKDAMQRAKLATYREELGSIGKSAASLINRLPGGKYMVPFFRTPVNLAKWAYQRGPTGIVSPKNWKDIVKGTTEERSEAAARLAFGQMLSMTMYMEAMKGNITGKLSDNKSERNLRMARGEQPYSVKIGDKYFSYRSFEPIATWMAMVSNMAEESKKTRTPLDTPKVFSIVAETAKMIKDQSYLQGIGDLWDALEDPENRGPKFIQALAASNIPSGVSYLARLYDPIIRDPGTIPESIKARIPYFSRGVAPKLDIWGRPITREGSLFTRALSPTGYLTSKPDLTTEELISLEKYPDRIMNTYKGLPLTVQERNSINEVEGKLQKELLDKLVVMDLYKNADPNRQAELVDSVMNKVRKNVRTPFFVQRAREELRKATTQEEKLMLIEKFTRKKLIKR